MKYKLPKPEDYPGTEGYEFKVSKAYARAYTDLLSLIVTVDGCINALKDGNDINREIAIQMLEDAIRKFK